MCCTPGVDRAAWRAHLIIALALGVAPAASAAVTYKVVSYTGQPAPGAAPATFTSFSAGSCRAPGGAATCAMVSTFFPQNAGIWSAGQIQGLIRDIPTCQVLIERIVRDAEEIITGRLAGMVGR